MQIENVFPETKEWKPGIYHNLTFAEYKAIPAINASSIKPAIKSLLNYKHSLAKPWGGSAATILGSAAHTLILEPDKFASEYYRMPDFEPIKEPTKEGSKNPFKTVKTIAAQEDEHAASFPTQQKLTTTQYTRAMGMASAIILHREASNLLRDTQRELTLVWDSPYGLCKARIDAYKDGWIGDLKTSESIDYRNFSKSVADFHYYLSMAFYKWGAEKLGLRVQSADLIAVQSDEPHDVVIYPLSERYLELGLLRAFYLLRKIKIARATNEYPGYSATRRVLEPEKWLEEQILNQVEEED